MKLHLKNWIQLIKKCRKNAVSIAKLLRAHRNKLCCQKCNHSTNNKAIIMRNTALEQPKS